MSSNPNYKHSADIKGIFSVDGDKITIQVEDFDREIDLTEFLKDFLDKPDVKLSVAYSQEIVG